MSEELFNILYASYKELALEVGKEAASDGLNLFMRFKGRPREEIRDTIRSLEQKFDEETKTETKTEKEEETDMSQATVASKESVTVVNHGTQIIIPEGMSAKDAMMHLKRREEQDNTSVAVLHMIETFPLDGAFALLKALRFKYGWADLAPTPGFFGSTPPAMVGVEVAPGETVQIPWGRMQVPGVEGYIEPQISKKDGRFIFAIGGEVKRKNEKQIQEIADLTRQFVKDSSIYKGKAIRWGFTPQGRNFDINDVPKFIDTSKIDTDMLVLPESVRNSVSANIFTPIEYTEMCRQNGVPLKRGVLLSGKYGTGKTLTAYVTAHKAVANGWTFIYLEKTENLAQAIEFARMYGPAIIFAEDIDRVTEGSDDDERSENLDRIANTLDGINTKDAQVFCILTTNHVDRINKVMLRPGRIDAYIEMLPPDALAVETLVRRVAGTLIDKDENISVACANMAGLIPALLTEIVNRSKLFAIARNGKNSNAQLRITEEDLIKCHEAMKPHLSLLEDKVNKEVKTELVLVQHNGGTLAHLANGLSHQLES